MLRPQSLRISVALLAVCSSMRSPEQLKPEPRMSASSIVMHVVFIDGPDYELKIYKSLLLVSG